MRWLLLAVLAMSMAVLWQVNCLRSAVEGEMTERVVIQEFRAEVPVGDRVETVTVYRFEGQALESALAEFDAAIAAVRSRR